MKPNLGRDYIIRQAYEFEGPVIQDLYKNTLVEFLDWDAPLDASWVLAVSPHKAEYYAVISLVASKPIGRLEMLRVREGIPKRLRACVVRDMVHYSLLTLKAYGCQAVTGASEQELVNTFGKVIQQRFHGMPIGQFTGYITRLT